LFDHAGKVPCQLLPVRGSGLLGFQWGSHVGASNDRSLALLDAGRGGQGVDRNPAVAAIIADSVRVRMPLTLAF
jgi:hypothetical protein